MNITEFSNQIIALCQQPKTALQAIHQILTKGSVTSRALMAVYERVMQDHDVDGAYYLACFAQKADDISFDVLPLVDMVMASDDEMMKQSLLEKLPQAAKEQLLQADKGE